MRIKHLTAPDDRFVPVDKGIPMWKPQEHSKKKPIFVDEEPRYLHYPWQFLEVGDSFLANCSRGSVCVNIRHQKARRGHCYAVRATPEGYRVWRTA